MYHRPLISKQFHLLLTGLVLAALLLTGLASPWSARPAHAAATKIMPLGDSITGSTCWRAKLSSTEARTTLPQADLERNL